jgi:hypothetical protein
LKNNERIKNICESVGLSRIEVSVNLLKEIVVKAQKTFFQPEEFYLLGY